MTGLLRRLDRYWFTSMPAERLAVLRILVGGYGLSVVGLRGAHAWTLASADPRLFKPVGVLSMLPSPPSGAWVHFLVLTGFLTGFAFLLGWRYRLTGPLYAVSLLVLLTYVNSWGVILHTEHLFWLYVMVLSASPAADALSMDARGGEARGRHTTVHARNGWAVRLMCVLAVIAYVLAGVAKLRNVGLEFVLGETLRSQVALDNVRKIELGTPGSPFAPWLLPYAGFFAVAGAATLALELGAPLALLHRRLAAFWAVGMWCFHVGVAVVMLIGFPFQLTFVAFAPFFPVERLAGLAHRWAGAGRSPKPTSGGSGPPSSHRARASP